MKRILYSAVLVSVAMLTACSGLLEETPLSNIPEADAYKSAKLLYINTVGSVTSSMGTVYKGNTDALCTIQDIAGGQVFNPGRGGGDWQDGGKHQVLFMHSWGNDNGYMSSGWNAIFNRVAAINKAIGTIEKYVETAQDPSILEDYIYEMRATRAIFYWYALDMYGNVPICAKSDQTVAETVQSDRKTVYEFVRDELTESIPHLKNEKGQDESSSYYGRVTKAAGYFLMARLALNAPVYLLDSKKPTKEEIEQCREMIRFSEDQFTYWDTPVGPEGYKMMLTPCVFEQYNYQTPIDASVVEMANSYLSLYSATGDKLALAKGKALVDAAVKSQCPLTGVLPTKWFFNPEVPYSQRTHWINCALASVNVLERFARMMGEIE